MEKKIYINNCFLRTTKKIVNAISKRESFGVLIVFILLCFVVSLLSGNFMQMSNILSVMRSFSYIAIMAIGMTLVIITAGIDLSVGSIFAFSGVMTAIFYKEFALPIPLCIVFGLIAGMLLGFLNGILINYARLPPFIATLGMMSIGRGLSYSITKGYPIQMPPSFNKIGQGSLWQIPLPAIYMILLAILFSIILKNTIFGRRVYAIGGSEESSRISGINVKTIKLCVYSLSGLLSGFAGIVTSARLGLAQSTAGLGYELDVIGAVIIGGASLNGGKGSIFSTILGAAIMGVLRNGLVLLDVSAYWQQTVIGLVIIIAVTADRFRYKK